MRDRASWYSSVTDALRPWPEEFSEVRPALLCQVELGLRLLERLDPAAPASSVWPLLGGYPFGAAAGLVTRQQEQQLVTNARHLLWTLRRNRMWQQSLDTYRSLPDRIRGYRLHDNDEPARRVEPFLARDRFEIYDRALQSLPSFDRSALPPAPAGSARFIVERRFRTSVTIPDELVFEPRPGHDLTYARQPGPLSIPLAELAATATWMDTAETAANIPTRSWARRFEELELDTRTADGTGFEQATELRLDRLTHLVGMVGAGKSTLMTLIAAWAARQGMRTTLVVGDVAEQLALTETFVALKLSAAPVLGTSTRERHAQRLHRRIASRTGRPLLLHEDHGFAYLSTVCALDAQRGLEAANPLRYSDAPCTTLYPSPPKSTPDPSSLPGRYRETEAVPPDTEDDRLGQPHGCPMWSRCPRHRSAHDMVDADIWVANPASLVQSAVPRHLNPERLRHLELACLRSDIVIVDEADRVQMHLDDTFAPASTLVTRGPESWLDRLGTHKIAELARKGRIQLAERDVERWTAALDVVSATTNRLYALLIDDYELRSWVEIDYFSAWTLQEKLLEDWFPGNAGSTDDLVEREEDVFDTEDAPAPRADRSRGQTTMWAQRRAEVTAQMDAFRDDPLGDRGSRNADADRLVRTTQDLLHTQDEARTRIRVRSLLEKLLRGAPGLDPASESSPMLSGDRQVAAEQSNSSTRRRRKPDPADIRGSEAWLERTSRRLEFTLQLAVLHQRLSRITYLWPHVESALHLDNADNELARRPPLDYAPIVPEAPMGNVLGFQYLPDDPDLTHSRAGHCTGTLRFFRCAGVGRELLHALPDLGADPAAGRPGPHVLLMSATSWAGTSTRAHVLAPVQAVLKPHPKAVAAVQSTTFRTKFLYDKDNRPITLSGQDQSVRTDVLRQLVSQLGRTPGNGDNSPIQEELAMIGDERRRRALLLVGSYSDASIAFEVLNQFPRWRGQIRVLTRDDADVDDGDLGHRRTSTVRRGDLASFADDESAEILIAPLMAIERGHNILSPARTPSGERVAAFGTVFFLVRPHPRPDDLSLAVFAINDWVSRFTRDLIPHPKYGTFSELVTQAADLGQAGRAFRRIARGEWRRLLTRRYIYSRLGPLEQESFAWDQLVSIWQVIGRLVRGGVPARVVFVDAAFAPAAAWKSAPGEPVPTTSREPDVGLLVRLRDVLAPYFASIAVTDPAESALVQTLYAPLYNALRKMDLDTRPDPLP
ncbi:hypothetical protein [Nocardia sp. NPDC057272]|uniref:pPIWI_RE_Z domain-containing protein n=1 Tax=Nocardia sp. NPDC057272 TaxID=3346079 RepID=UPI00363EC5A3